MNQPRLLSFCLFLTVFIINNSKAVSLYWDANDVSAGAGASPAGSWDTSAFWSTDSTGQTTPGTWTDNNTAVFSAGTDATNIFIVSINGTVTPAGVMVEEGTVTNSGGTISLSGNVDFNVASGATNVITSTVTGSRVVKSGGGFLNLGTSTAQANTFTGGLIVSGGTLSFPGEANTTNGIPNPLGYNPASVQSSHIIISNNATLRSTKTGANSSFVFANRGINLGTDGGNLEVTSTGSTDYLVYSGIISGPGSLTKVGSSQGTLYLQSVNTYSGPTTNKAGFIGMNGTTKLGTNTIYLAGGGISAFATTAGITNTMIMSANTTFRASSTLTSGERRITLTNIFTGTAGTLTLRNAGSSNSTFCLRFYNGGFTFARPIAVGSASDAAGTIWRMDLYNTTNTGDLTLSGVISGPGSIRRSCNNDGEGGRLILSGANTFTGGSANNGGYIGFGSSTAPSGATGTNITSGPLGKGLLSIGTDPYIGFYANGAARSVGNDIDMSTGTAPGLVFIGSFALTFNGALSLGTLDRTFTVSNTALTTIGGAITGTASITKMGPGALAFGGSNTYTGDTLVLEGTLLANNTNGSGTSAGTVTVAAGATLGGKGTIAGPISVSGTLAPGSLGLGKLTVGNGIDLSGASMTWDLPASKDDATGTAGVDFDQLSVAGGTMILGGTSQLVLNFATPPSPTNSFWKSNHTWTIIAMNGGNNSGNQGFASIQNATYPNVGYFTSSVDGSGNVLLSFTSTYVSPPQPTIDSTITGAGTANLGLSWSSSNGGIYQVQYKTDLNQTNWITLTTITANGSTTSFTDTNSPSTNRFYRVIAP